MYLAQHGDPTCTYIVGLFDTEEAATEAAIEAAESTFYTCEITGEDDYESWCAVVYFLEVNATYKTHFDFKHKVVWENPYLPD